MKKKVFNNEILIDLWCNKNETLQAIGAKVNASPKTVQKAIKELGLVRNYQNENWLKEKHYIGRLNCKEIAILAYCSVDTIYVWMRKFDIKISEEITKISVSKYIQDDLFFEIIDTERKAYWLGFIVADGNITHNTLTISLSRKDRSHLQKFLSDLESDRPIYDYTTTLASTLKTYKMSRINVNSKTTVESLKKQNVYPQKSLNEVMPDIPIELIRHFLRGYFDGDGCFSYGYRRNGRCWGTFSLVGSFDFLLKAGDIIYLHTGVDTSVYKKQNKLKSLAAGGKDAITILAWLYDNATIYLDRKYNHFQQYLSSIE